VGGKRGADQPQHKEREGHDCGVLAALVRVLDDVGEATLRQGQVQGGAQDELGPQMRFYGLVDHARLQRVEHDASYRNPAHVGT